MPKFTFLKQLYPEAGKKNSRLKAGIKNGF